jgi:outer membrane usher protein
MDRWMPQSRWLRASSLCLAVLAALVLGLPAARAEEQPPGQRAAEAAIDDPAAVDQTTAPEPMDQAVAEDPMDQATAPDPMDQAVAEDPMDQAPADLPPVDPAALDLQLDVKINGYSQDIVAGFKQMPDGRIASHRSELTDIGILVPGEGPADEMITLDAIPGISYVYDESNQAIELEVPDQARLARHLSHGGDDGPLKPESALGVAVNYTAYAGASYQIPASDVAFDGVNLSLDARAFSKFGTFRQTGIVGSMAFTDVNALRLETSWSYSDPVSMRTYRLGDIISGGPLWTRPVWLGGAQVQRNFALRPDLVTMPLPQIQGTAAVPSALDIFIGQTKAFSSDVQPGPFSLDDLPVFTDSGTARIVLTDSSGRSIETLTPFFTSAELLKKGLLDYSIESGVVRRNYGTDSFGYDDQPVGIASFRYGLTDGITVESHVEGKSDMLNVGFGATASARRLGLVSAAVAASKFGNDQGFNVFGSWQAQFGDLSLYASTSRRFGEFYDLAAATAIPLHGKPLKTDVPEAEDQISLGYTIPGLEAGTGVSLVHQKFSRHDETLLLSGSLSKPFGNGVSLFATGYWDFYDRDGYGAYLGVSIPLGKRISATASTSAAGKTWEARAEAVRPMDQHVGDYGWRVGHSEGSDPRSSTAYGSYRSSFGVAEGTIYQQSDDLSGNAAFSGAVAVAGGSVFAGNTIPDAFAVVNVGTPGVAVSYENSYAGKTGRNGKLLLPNLRSFQKNKISIDVNDLPMTASADQAEATVVPREGAGVVVDFGVKADAAGVLVTLVDEAGQPLQPGLAAQLNGGGDEFVVGYDGEVFVTGATADNTLTVALVDGSCAARFAYAPDGSGQPAVGPVTCAPAGGGSQVQ